MTSKPVSDDRPFILGTRASPLALWQSDHVAFALAQAHGWPQTRIKLEKIITEGDKRLDTTLSEIGGKGLFTEELEEGLRAGSLDLAVHSLKDLPTAMPDGLVLGAILPRANAGDVLVAASGKQFKSLADLPVGAKIGTASLRRAAQIMHLRPDCEIAPMRGNVGTRLKKLDAEGFDATILAAAGLARLGIELAEATLLSADDILPAAGQGALAVQCRADDAAMRTHLGALHCADTHDCVTAERSFLAALDGSCRTPIAAFARLSDGELTLTGRVLSDDGRLMAQGVIKAAREKADETGRALASELAEKMQVLRRDKGLGE